MMLRPFPQAMQGLVYLDFLEPDEYAPSIRTLQSRIPLERRTRESRCESPGLRRAGLSCRWKLIAQHNQRAWIATYLDVTCFGSYSMAAEFQTRLGTRTAILTAPADGPPAGSGTTRKLARRKAPEPIFKEGGKRKSARCLYLLLSLHLRVASSPSIFAFLPS